MTTYLLLLISALLLPFILGNSIDVPTNKKECEGSVTLYEGSKEPVVVTEDGDVKVNVDKLKLEGCGCFSIYSKKGGRGRSFFLGRTGEYSDEDIGWNKIRHVKRVTCESRAMPVWGVMVIVLGLVLLVAVVAVFAFRRFREYKKVASEGDP